MQTAWMASRLLYPFPVQVESVSIVLLVCGFTPVSTSESFIIWFGLIIYIRFGKFVIISGGFPSVNVWGRIFQSATPIKTTDNNTYNIIAIK